MQEQNTAMIDTTADTTLPLTLTIPNGDSEFQFRKPHEAMFVVASGAGTEVLRIDEAGFTYLGERVADAGEAHRAFIAAMGVLVGYEPPRHDGMLGKKLVRCVETLHSQFSAAGIAPVPFSNNPSEHLMGMAAEALFDLEQEKAAALRESVAEPQLGLG